MTLTDSPSKLVPEGLASPAALPVASLQPQQDQITKIAMVVAARAQLVVHRVLVVLEQRRLVELEEERNLLRVFVLEVA